MRQRVIPTVIVALLISSSFSADAREWSDREAEEKVREAIDLLKKGEVDAALNDRSIPLLEATLHLVRKEDNRIFLGGNSPYADLLHSFGQQTLAARKRRSSSHVQTLAVLLPALSLRAEEMSRVSPEDREFLYKSVLGFLDRNLSPVFFGVAEGSTQLTSLLTITDRIGLYFLRKLHLHRLHLASRMLPSDKQLDSESVGLIQYPLYLLRMYSETGPESQYARHLRGTIVNVDWLELLGRAVFKSSAEDSNFPTIRAVVPLYESLVELPDRSTLAALEKMTESILQRRNVDERMNDIQQWGLGRVQKFRYLNASTRTAVGRLKILVSAVSRETCERGLEIKEGASIAIAVLTPSTPSP